MRFLQSLDGAWGRHGCRLLQHLRQQPFRYAPSTHFTLTHLTAPAIADVVKTKMQGTAAKQYSSTLDCFVKIFRNDGIAGFYKGIVPRCGRVVPGQGIIFMSFETIQGWVEESFFTKKV